VLATSQEIMPIACTLTAEADVDVVLVQRLECRQEENCSLHVVERRGSKGSKQRAAGSGSDDQHEMPLHLPGTPVPWTF
jgi:hypothetical protein